MRGKVVRNIIVTLIVLAIVVIVTTLVFYRTRLSVAIRADVNQSLEDVSSHGVGQLSSRLDDDLRALLNISDFLGKAFETGVLRPKSASYAAEARFTHFQNIVFADISGTVWDASGPTDRSLSEKQYFQQALVARADDPQAVLSFDADTGSVVVATSVFKDDLQAGVVVGSYPVEQLLPLLPAQEFDGRGYSYLIGRDGTILLDSPNAVEAGSNFGEFLSAHASTDIAERIHAIQDRNGNGSIPFRLDGHDVLMEYLPIGVGGWYLMTIMPQDIMSARTWEIFKHVLEAFGVFAILFIILVSYVLWLHSKDRKRLDQANHDMNRISDILPGGICRFLRQDGWPIIFMNPGFLQLVGYSAEELKARVGDKLASLIYPADLVRMGDVVGSLADGIRTSTEYLRLVCADSSLKWVLFNAELGGDDDEGECVHSTFVNISSLKQVEEQLQLTKRRYDLILDQTEDIIFDWNIRDRSVYFSHTFTRKLGREPVTGNFPENAVQSGIVDQRDAQNFLDSFHGLEKGKSSFELELRLKNAEEESIWFRMIATTVFGGTGEPIRAVGTLQDIDTQKRTLLEAADSANRDSLTQLYNRRMTARLIDARLSEQTVTGSLAVIDIDDFKLVNDSMGHLYGDFVLNQMVRVLLENTGPDDIVGRIGGDEFCVFFSDTIDEWSVRRRASNILATLFDVGRSNTPRYELSASIGIVIKSEEDPVATFEGLFQKADTALYFAKRLGKNCYVIYSAMVEQAMNPHVDGPPAPLLIDDSVMRQKLFRDRLADCFFKASNEFSDLNQALHSLLGTAGHLIGAGRGIIYEYSGDDAFFSNTFEWCDDGVPSAREWGRRIASMDYSELKNYFDDNDIFFCPDVRKLPGRNAFEEFVKSRGSLSVLFFMIMERGRRKALLGFEQFESGVLPSYDEMVGLSQFAKLTGLLLIHDQENQRLFSILSNHVDAASFVIDATDYRLTFCNDKVARRFPAASVGSFCHQAIRGNPEPCADCPLLSDRFKNGGSTVLSLHDGSLASATFSRFTLWDRRSCLVSLRFEEDSRSECTHLVDVMDEIIYVSDPVTYELLYVNRSGRNYFHLHDDDYIGKPCFALLQGRSSPCPYCTNDRLRYDEFYAWEFTNALVGRHFLLKDKLIDWGGRTARIEFALDITEKESVSQSLRDRLDRSQVIIESIGALVSAENLDTAVNLVLEKLGTFYAAKRAYIFELDASATSARNTYEWHAEMVASRPIQTIPPTMLRRWLIKFSKKESLVIDDVDSLKDDEDPEEYEVLKRNGVDSLYATPLYIKDKLVGFLGMDDPTFHRNDLSTLDSLSYFIIEEIIKRRMQVELATMGYHDTLTGLPNRSSYVRRLAELGRIEPKTVGVLIADINGLKQTNLDYGHSLGDSRVTGVGRALRNRFSGYDVFRRDGDEFVVICEGIDQGVFIDLIQKLRKDMEALSVSIGHTWSDVSPDVETLISHADELMNMEKQQYYTAVATSGKHFDPVRLERLQKSIESGSFLMYLQPKYTIDTGKLYGAEALCRYWSEEHGLIPPSMFIPVLEKAKVIKYVDLYIFEQVCRSLERWIKTGREVIPVSLNFSRITLLEAGLVDEMVSIQSKYCVPRELIEIEITESIGEMERELVAEIGARIQEQGFPISLDDFGSKYTSMSILSAVPFHTLKLDRSLVNDLEVNERTKILVRHIIDMCGALEVACVAEGVETSGQLSILREMNCDYAQGYYFDKPMPLDQFEQKYIASTRPPRPARGRASPARKGRGEIYSHNPPPPCPLMIG
jgi:diguanylate cyclase (GGDEF)-like protein